MICIAWWGFPQYAARCVASLVKSIDEKVVVVATRPAVPVGGMEALCGCVVHWVAPDSKIELQTLLGEMPRVMFSSGWAIPTFNRFARQVKCHGGRVYAMVDNNMRLSVKEVLRMVKFRLFIRKTFDGYLVPGQSGRRLLKFYGVPESNVSTGMYSADASLFQDGESILKRPKRIVYVGQFCARKNIIRLVDAFLLSNARKNGWTLALYGCGPLKDAIPRDLSVEVHDFLQPEDLAKVYKSARVFALASLEEHWGLVVHEAVLSGCVLLLSDCIGAGEDFLSKQNGVCFNPHSVESMISAINYLVGASDEYFLRAQEESLTVAKTVTVNDFASGCIALMK